VFTEAAGSLASGSALNEITIDLGTISLDGGDAAADIVFYNNANGSTGAPMDVKLISSSGDVSSLFTDFSSITSVGAGSSETIGAVLSDDTEGTFASTFTFESVNDESLFGTAGSGTTLVVNLLGEVGSGVCIPDFAEPFGQLNFLDVSAFLNAFGNQDLAADLDNSGSLNFLDVSAFLSAYGDGCP